MRASVCVCVCVKEHKENIAQRECMRCSKATVCVCVRVCVRARELGRHNGRIGWGGVGWGKSKL